MFERLFTLLIVLLVTVAALRWLNGGFLPTAQSLAVGTARWPFATAAMVLVALWGATRALGGRE